MICLPAGVLAAPATPLSVQPFDTASGTFDVVLRPQVSGEDMSVLVPVWSMPGQEDIVWYTATRDGSVWKLTVPISNHRWNLGTYTIHAYLDTGSSMRLLGGTSTVVRLPENADLKIESDSAQTILTASLENCPLPQNSPVWFQARTEHGTSKIYIGSWNGTTFEASIPVMDFRVSGPYTIGAFLGQSGAIASGTVSVRSVFGGQIVSENVDGRYGTFDIVAEAHPCRQIASIQAAVWQQPDQSDLRWYTMEKAGDRFHAQIRVADHGHAFGAYNVHAYATLTNGVMELAAATVIPLEPQNYLYAQADTPDAYTIRLVGSDAKAARVAVWSAMQGQDDLAWYAMQRQEDGSWTVRVDMRRHPGGRFLAHAYSGDTFLGGISFPESTASGSSSLVANDRLQRDAEAVYAKAGRDLKAVYDFVSTQMNYVSRDGHIVPPPGYTRQEWYAVEGFETLRGNCYSFASMFYELAKRLGYEAEYVEGEVPSVSGSWIGHGFVLITIDGSTFICDPVFQHSSTSGRNYYMQPIEKPRTTYRW